MSGQPVQESKPPDAEASPPAPEPLFLRILILAVLYTLANTWALRHLGSGLFSTTALNGALAMLLGAVTFLSKMEEKRHKRAAQKLFHHLIGTPSLVSIAIVLALAGSQLSSVTLVAGPTASGLTVTLTPAGSDDAGRTRTLDPTGGTQRLLCWITPFGRSFLLTANGRLPLRLDVHPWTGVTVRIDRDLRPYPTVLIRIPANQTMLVDGGSIRLRVDGQTLPPIPLRDKTSLLLGPGNPGLNVLASEWRAELTAMGDPPQQREKAIRRWLQPAAASMLLEPSARVEVEFVSAAGVPKSRAAFTVSNAALQDVELLPLGDES